MFSSFWMPNQGYLLTGYTICDMQQSGLDVDLYGLMTNVIRLSSPLFFGVGLAALVACMSHSPLLGCTGWEGKMRV
jgi:hypothetical protein